MKNTKLLVTIAFFLGAISIFSACKKGGDDPSNPFVGKWEVTHSKLETLDSTKTVVDTEDTTYIHGKSQVITFNSDNTFSGRDYSATPDTATTSGTYSLLGSDKLIVHPVGENADTSSYTISGGTMTLKDEQAFFSSFTLRQTVTLMKQ